jgi:hypothetical protein
MPCYRSSVKKKTPPQKSRTHFDLIPVAIVKKIAQQDVPATKKAGTHRAALEPAVTKIEPYTVPSHLLHRTVQ